ncbi:MAG: adenylate/guanylate cyclase domain-containing protein [Gammaproteobacteria bacterium]|nr:adenylate/guanylate cyclase domain-containing protein [Gammaproteobacteria bacterium]
MRRPFVIERIVPFLLSMILMGGALWITLTPYKSGTTIGAIQTFFYRMDKIRHDIKLTELVVGHKINKKKIVIVGIDGKSILQEGPWPWRYNRIVKLITRLREQGVSVIAFDSVFNQEERNIVNVIEEKLTKERMNHFFCNKNLDQLKTEFDENNLLIQQVKNNNDIVLSFLLNNSVYTQGILPKPFITLNQHEVKETPILSQSGYLANFKKLQLASVHNGFISAQPDQDGIIRQQALVARYKNKVYLSLPLVIAKHLYPERKIQLNTTEIIGFQYLKSIQFGNTEILTDENAQVWIPVYDKKSIFKYLSASDVLNNQSNLDTLKSAVVFIGSTSSGLRWFDEKYQNKLNSNIEVQAITLKAILDGELLYTPYWGKAFTVGLILVLGLLLPLILPLLRMVTSIFLAFLLQTVMVLINLISFVKFGCVLSLAVPLLMGLLLIIIGTVLGFLLERRRKSYLREAFSQYIPPDYLKLLLENPDAYGFEGKSVELTVLFADIRHFTTISENLDASSLKKLLNKFFTPMTRIILKHGGTIDKYVGDMIMAFWGAPIENVNHAEAAIDASLDMLAKTSALEKDFRAHELPEIQLGIGLNTGLMNVGDMGSKFRRSYTVIGDAVNLGSRLQSATAYYGVNLLVCGTTKAHQTKFVFRLIDRVKFKGKQEVVEVYEVVCRKSDVTSALTEEIEAHEHALNAYFAKNWTSAATLFEALVYRYPNTKVYSLFWERIISFEKESPSADWDGAYVFKDK